MSSHRRPIAVAAAILTAAALGTTAFVLPATAVSGVPAAAGAPAPATVPVLNGTLDWGVLDVYRNYVTHIAKGVITTADGATLNQDGTFRFGAATGQYDPADGKHIVTAAFKGSVTFDAPLHGFTVKLENLRIDSGTKKLIVDVTRDGKLTPNVAFADVAFDGMKLAGLGTKLTKEAADLMGAPQYTGRDADKLTATLEFPKPPSSPSPSVSASASASASPTQSASPSASASPTKSASPSASATPSTGTGSPSIAPTGPQKVLTAKLTWGVKESFRTYVLGGGSITPAGGALKNGDLYDFALAKGDLDAAKQKLNVSFEGNLRFLYADHGLDLTFGNPRVEASGKAGTLYVDVKNAAGNKAAVPFATLDLSKTDYKTKNGVLALNGVPAAFTAQGAAAFARDGAASQYKAGEAIDPLSFSVSVDKDATLPTTGGATGGSGTTGGTGGTGTTGGGSVAGGSVGGSTGGNLASTGSEIPAGALLGASAAVVAAGAGAVFVARRRRTVQN
ncbi:HtaA domain-containing protein [Streptomyces sp. NPDC101733]|uniref:HtaA domain-containing protein n=1 Tax=unclassified Streptomyces TaxID=2593676 RepID=UPI0038117CE6